MKIIFLDIDGVMNSQKYLIEVCKRKRNGDKIDPIDMIVDPDMVLHLKYIAEMSGAKIVLSSTWRLGYPDDPSYLSIVKLLEDNDMEILGVTPFRSKSGNDRGNEIRDWLKSFKESEITKFVILDDDNDMCEFTNTNLVQTNCFTGLTEQNVYKAIQILME